MLDISCLICPFYHSHFFLIFCCFLSPFQLTTFWDLLSIHSSLLSLASFVSRSLHHSLTCLCARLPISLPSILYLMRRESLNNTTTQSSKVPLNLVFFCTNLLILQVQYLLYHIKHDLQLFFIICHSCMFAIICT